MSTPRIHPRGSRNLIVWDGHPREAEYRTANGELGMCNTGSGKSIVCCLGGIGCDVDHALIATDNLAAPVTPPNPQPEEE